jgi:hypothetical protein
VSSLTVALLAAGAACLSWGLAQESTGIGAGAGPEWLRLRLVNAAGGIVEASADQGETWAVLGHVVVPATTVSPAGFTASSWAQDSAVAATSVNAIHVRVCRSASTGRAVVFSVVPRGPIMGAAGRRRSSAVMTDMPGGEGIFGWGLGPYVGAPVYLTTDTGLRKLATGYEPADGDVLTIVIRDPLRTPRYAVFENRPGGAVTLDMGDGRPVRLGRVDRPVTGIGRFSGTVHAAAGRIRANHPGVVDVSTSPLGMPGGFQVIPRQHARSPEMVSPGPASQWLVVGPDDPATPDWAGSSPLFSGLILPSYRKDDLTGPYGDWMVRALSRVQVQVSYGTGSWNLMPRIAFTSRGARDTGPSSGYGRRGVWLIPAETDPARPMTAGEKAEADTALADVTAVRIVFAWGHFPLTPVIAPEPSDSAEALAQ